MLKEQHPFWSAWTRVIIRRPWVVVGVCVIVTACFGAVVWETPKDLSFTGLLPETDVEMKHFRQVMDTFSSDTNIVILVEGERRDVDRAIAALADELGKMPQVHQLRLPADPAWLVERAPWVWPRPLFDAAVKSVRTGETPLALQTNIDAADTVIRKSLQPVEKASLLKIGLNASPLDMAMGGADYFAIEREAERILSDGGFGVTHGFTGLAAAAAQDQRNVIGRIRILSPITFVAVLILLAGVERRLSRVALAGIALAATVVISLGLTGIAVGRLSITVTFFGMLLLGLGIDFAIHLLVAMRDALSHGKNAEESVRYGIRHTATAIALGGITTALAFGLVSLAPEAGARDMGLAALFGLLVALVMMLTFLPTTWLLLERRHAHKDAPPRFFLPGLESIVSFSLKYPKVTVGLGALVVLFGVTGIPRYKLERDLEAIISRSVTSFDVDKRLQELWGVSPVTFIAPVESIEAARSLKQQLLKLDDIAAVSSVADIILPDAAERAEELRGLMATLPDDHMQGPLYARLAAASEAGPITVERIPNSISSGVVGPNGELAITIVPKQSTLDAEKLEKRIAEVRSVAPTATGLPIIIKTVAMGGRDYIPIILVGISAAVVLVLSIAFRNVRDVVLALAPVAVGASAAFGAFLWFGLQMSVLTSVVVPVILGLGVDDGIHVVERLRQYKVRTDETLHEAIEGVGRAIFLTTATTCVSFVVFIFTDHAGLEGIAWFMLIGMPGCFLASVTVLPAAAKLLARDASTIEGEVGRG